MVNVIQFSRLSTDISVFIYLIYLSLGNNVICKGECHKMLTFIDCSSSILCNNYYTPPLFIEVSEPSQERSRSCICLLVQLFICLLVYLFTCLLVYLFASFYDFSIIFCNCSYNVVFLFLFFSVILAQMVSLFKTKPFHKSRQCGIFVFHFLTYLVYMYIYLLM